MQARSKTLILGLLATLAVVTAILSIQRTAPRSQATDRPTTKAATQPVPDPLPAEPHDPPVRSLDRSTTAASPEDGCEDPIPTFLTRVAELRAMPDDEIRVVVSRRPDTGDPQHRAAFPTRPSLSAFGRTPEPPPAEVTWYESLMACAGETGRGPELTSQLLAVFSDEARPVLKRHWLRLIALYDACDAQILAVVRSAAAAALASETTALEGGNSPYILFLYGASDCAQLEAPVVPDIAALLDSLEDDHERDVLLVMLGIYFSFDEVADIVRQGLAEGRHGAVELLRVSDLDAAALVDFLRTNDVLTTLVGPDASAVVRVSTLELLAAKGGSRGASELQALVDDPRQASDLRAAALGYLARSAHGPGLEFYEGFLSDPQLGAAAIAGIGALAVSHDDAYHTLVLQARSAATTDLQLAAMGQLIQSGRDGLPTLFRTLFDETSEGELRTAALSHYIRLPEADPEFLDRVATDPSLAPDPSLRAHALFERLSWSGDLDGALDTMRAMAVADPDMSTRHLALALTAGILRSREDAESIAEAEALLGQLPSEARGVVDGELERRLASYRSTDFVRGVERYRLFTAIARKADSPLADALERRLALLEHLHEPTR